MKQQYDFDSGIKANYKDLYKINNEENYENSLNKFIKEDIAIYSANNNEKEVNLDIINCEHIRKGPNIDIIKGFIEQEDNIDCEHGDDPNIRVFIKVNEEEKIECDLGNNPNIGIIKGFIKVMQEDKGERISTRKRLVKWENDKIYQHHTMTTRMSTFKIPRQTWWIGWYEWLWWTEWSWWKHFILDRNKDKH
jgi:hypothetical protein